MATRKQDSTNYKAICTIFLIVFLALAGWRGGIIFSNIGYKQKTDNIQLNIQEEQGKLSTYYQKPGFDKLLYVKELESSDSAMPWSDHVNAIMSIFGELLAVDNSDTFNISFSDFEISLEKIRLSGYVTNLRLLYQGSGNKRALIQMFEELDFLEDISIKTYEKSSQDFGYEFVLTANVINNGK